MDTDAERISRLALPPARSDVFRDTLRELLDNTPKMLTDLANAEDVLRRMTGPRAVFELLQNTRDAAKAAAIKNPRFHLEVTDDALLLANEGAPFSRDGYEAVTGIAKSPKRVRREGGITTDEPPLRFGQVGHKGIGFRSVLHLSRRPEIYSTLEDGSHFALAFGQERIAVFCRRAVAGDQTGLLHALEDWERPIAEAMLKLCPLMKRPLYRHRGRRGIDPDALPSQLPVLSLPLFNDRIPTEVKRLLGWSTEGEHIAKAPFSTIIRLPLEADQVEAVRSRVKRDMAMLREGRRP